MPSIAILRFQKLASGHRQTAGTRYSEDAVYMGEFNLQLANIDNARKLSKSSTNPGNTKIVDPLANAIFPLSSTLWH